MPRPPWRYTVIWWRTLQIRAWLSDCQEGKEVMLTAIPLFHVYGMVVGLSAAIQMAASTVLVPNPARFGFGAGRD